MAIQMAVDEINAKGGVQVGGTKHLLKAYSIDTREHEPGIPVHDALTDCVRHRYGFDYPVSNDLLYETGILTGKVKIQVYYDKKAEWVRTILNQFGVRPEEVIAIGDSVDDIDMFQMVGFSISFNSSCRDLDQIASVCIQSQNLADIIPRLPV